MDCQTGLALTDPWHRAVAPTRATGRVYARGNQVDRLKNQVYT